MPLFSTHTTKAFNGQFYWTVKVSYNHWAWHRLDGGLAPDEETAEATADASRSLHMLQQGFGSDD